MEQRDVESLNPSNSAAKKERCRRLTDYSPFFDDLTGINYGARRCCPAPRRCCQAASRCPWSRRPEVLKGLAVGESLFTITEILVPSSDWSVVPGDPLTTGVTGLTAESFTETTAQDGMSEMLMGRRLAEEIGVVAEHYGMTDDGISLRDLIQDKGGTVSSTSWSGCFRTWAST